MNRREKNELVPESARSRIQSDRTPEEQALYARVGEHLRGCRKEAGLTIAEVSARAKLNPTYLGELERGRANVSVSTLWALSEVFGMPLRALLPDVGPTGGAEADTSVS